MTRKIPRPVEKALVQSLAYILENKSSASRVVKYTLTQNKKWGSRDRRVFAEAFYDILRDYRSYAYPFSKSANDLNLSEEKLTQILESWREKALKRSGVSDKVKYSVSEDLYTKLKKEFDEEKVRSFLEESHKQAQAFLRVNTLKTDTESLKKSLESEGVETSIVKENCLVINERKNVFVTDSFKKGLFEMQDGASQDVAPFLEVEPGQRVIDSCAGAGGKSLHIASLMKNKGKIIAMDIFEKRLEELKKRSKRAGVHNIEIKAITNTKSIKRLENSADRLLLDVPCTGTGVYRRKPESKLFFTKEEHSRLNKLQHEIIQSHSRMLKSGGKMIYATCSVLPSENIEVVNGFLSQNSDFQLEEARTNDVGENGFDGFFMAKIIKK